MKTLDDALAVLDTQQEEIQYCTIDPETREITVPDTYKILGVESDDRSLATRDSGFYSAY